MHPQTYHERFPGKAVFPVIHVMSYDQLTNNLETAAQCEVDGAFVIDHAATSSQPLSSLLLGLHRDGWLKRLWIGANFLGSTNDRAFALAHSHRLSGVWSDNAKPFDPATSSSAHWRKLADENAKRQSKVVPLYFGGVAFKYQPRQRDTAAEAHAAIPYVDVVTTSGPETGRPASIEKLLYIRHAIGDHPLAVASGVTPENAAEQFRYVDAVLVATGISNGDFYHIDPDKLKRLVEVARNYQSPQ